VTEPVDKGDALALSWTRVAHADISTLAKDSGAQLVDGAALRLRVIDRECLVDPQSRSARWTTGTRAELGRHLQILVLHYVLGSGKAQLANRLASFRDFEGGAIYYAAFKARSVDLLVREFGARSDTLRHVGDAIRAEQLRMNGVGMRVSFFPKLPITVHLWPGDDEVPPSANVLFDANAGKILPTEDLSVAAGVLVRRLVELSRA